MQKFADFMHPGAAWQVKAPEVGRRSQVHSNRSAEIDTPRAKLLWSFTWRESENERNQRVADYVAGTVIVRDKHSEEIRPDWNASSRGNSLHHLAPDNYHASSDGTMGAAHPDT